MKDIRIITGKPIIPPPDTVNALFAGTHTALDVSGITELYDRLLPKLKLHTLPKAALCIQERKNILHSDHYNPDALLLCAMLTIGSSIQRLIDRYAADGDPLAASLLNAMADSCLFAWEEQLHSAMLTLCREKNCGILRRLELPSDLPMHTQKAVFEALDADRTLGLSLTEGYMLSPEKSMSLIFELDELAPKKVPRHDCGKCRHPRCGFHSSVNLQIEQIRTDGTHTSPRTISCKKGSRLFDVLQEHRIPVSADCGGAGTCGKCGVTVRSGSVGVSPEDKLIFSEAELNQGMRLACSIRLEHDLSVLIPQAEETAFQILKGRTSYVPLAEQARYAPGSYGIAIDIGTTTIAFALLDLHTGICAASHTAINSCRAFGTDVIRRIQASNEGKKDQLQKTIQKDLLRGIDALLNQCPAQTIRLQKIVIAANTVMLHLLRGYSCEGFCRYPFSPVTLEREVLSFTEAFGASFDAGTPDVILLPGISAFVGADITAGLSTLSTRARNGSCLFLDLGTNGELALFHNHRLFTASTAAGPVFEGGNIRWGTGSIPGAIANVSIGEEGPSVCTVADMPPIGICGTGVIETVSELLSAEIIDKTGKLKEAYFEKGYPLANTMSGKTILFTQRDIREVQMAKAAIRAGIEILLLTAGISCDKIEQVFLAGGFGYYLNIPKAASVGILPKKLVSKTTAAGNTSLTGALFYLAKQTDAVLSELAADAVDVPLAADKHFQELYLSHMEFEKIT